MLSIQLLFVYLFFMIPGSQGVICLFYHLKSTCQYRLDGFAMSRITAIINECNEPIDIKFKITCDNPKLEWTRTFVASEETQEVPGYFQKVFLQVKQRYSSQTKKYGIQAYVLSTHMKTVEIMNSNITLYGTHCSLLKKKSEIAVAVLGSLLGVVIIALIFICVIKRRRDQAFNYPNSSSLIENPELQESSYPVESVSMPSESTNQHQPSTYQDMVTFSGLSQNDENQRF